MARVVLFEPGRDIFADRADALVCAVNCVGVMGRGIAKEVRLRYDCSVYFAACRNGLRPGGMVRGGKIVFAATKDHWRNPSQYEWIRRIAEDLPRLVRREKIKRIAIPALGCANGQLQWPKVRDILLRSLLADDTPTQYALFPPGSR